MAPTCGMATGLSHPCMDHRLICHGIGRKQREVNPLRPLPSRTTSGKKTRCPLRSRGPARASHRQIMVSNNDRQGAHDTVSPPYSIVIPIVLSLMGRFSSLVVTIIHIIAVQPIAHVVGPISLFGYDRHHTAFMLRIGHAAGAGHMIRRA